ncbi:MAG: hypothetical protein K8R76_07475 [Candidatus Aegiribacteria sp.]|nr:hypothetical protein [Candidatus Aegiribacteria sp.]
MNAKEQNAQSNDNNKDSEKIDNTDRPAEFRLVLWMLSSLTILLLLLIVLPFIIRNESNSSDFIEYYKWVLPALLGTFGAWIGAGAAYYFGKENLKLSSKSTQDALALEFQGDTSKFHADNATIEDIKPTPLDPVFKFTMDSKISEVVRELNKNVDYWFIPVLEDSKMKDVIHIEALWRFYKNKDDNGDKNISELLKDIENVTDSTKSKLSKLHGFFEEFTMNDHISDSLKMMIKSDKIVGIVCDDQDKATHCFVRRDLKTFMLGIRTDDA